MMKTSRENTKPVSQLVLLRLSEGGGRNQPVRLDCWSHQGWRQMAVDDGFVRAFNPDCETAEFPTDTMPAELPEGAHALLLLPGSWVWSGLETIPKAARRQNSAIGYMVEERLAQDVEDLHFACQPRSGDLCSVYAIDREKMDALHSQLQRLDLPIVAAVPQYQLLDLLETDIGLWLDGDQAHIWHKIGYGLSVRRQYLQPLLAQLAHAEGENGGESTDAEGDVPGLQLLGAGSDDAMAVAELESLFADRLQQHAESPEEVLLAHCKPGRLANLLSGEYEIEDGGEERNWWLPPAKVAAACFVVQLLLFVGAGSYFQWRASSAETEARALFSQLFPQDRPGADIRRQIEGYLNRAGASGGNFASQMQLLSRVWGQHKSGLKLQSLRFDGNRGEMVLQLQAPNLTDLDTVVGQLSGGQFRAELLAANELEEGVSGRIRLR